MRKSRAKYRHGGCVNSLNELACYLSFAKHHNPLFYFGSTERRPISWWFLQNMQFRVIANAIKNGRLWYAVKREVPK